MDPRFVGCRGSHLRRGNGDPFSVHAAAHGLVPRCSGRRRGTGDGAVGGATMADGFRSPAPPPPPPPPTASGPLTRPGPPPPPAGTRLGVQIQVEDIPAGMEVVADWTRVEVE